MTPSKKTKDTEWKKIFANIYLIRGLYLESIKTSNNSKIKTKMQFKNMQGICIDISPKEICR